MEIDHSRVQDLLERLTESLNVEVKRWIRIDDPEGAAKIVRGVLALRNRNGGFFVIGFDDKTLLPDIGNEPADVGSEFHVDKVQALISRYSYELFEIGVAFGKLQGREYPVIVVPEGVRTPVAAKADLMNGQNPLVRFGAVYFRTLSSNGTVSTAVTRPRIGRTWSKSVLKTVKPTLEDSCAVNWLAKTLRRWSPHFNKSKRGGWELLRA